MKPMGRGSHTMLLFVLKVSVVGLVIIGIFMFYMAWVYMTLMVPFVDSNNKHCDLVAYALGG
jgi:hypothetical protein